MKRSFTTLTEATLITAVVQHGYGEIITDALLEVGIQGSTVHAAMGAVSYTHLTLPTIYSV